MRPAFYLVLALLTGCAGVDYDYPRAENGLIPSGNTTALDAMGRKLLASANTSNSNSKHQSGFLLLEDGVDAIAARIRLAAEAERSIDVQYYLIKRDSVGLAFLGALLAAADRGVRVRLLVDDMFNGGFDDGMTALNSHPNFEIRVFNPFNRGLLGKPLGAPLNFARINRRMHNKSFTADSRFTIIGGRNIADEYFGAREDAAFGDLDVLGVGPIVGDVNTMFERYWVHKTAIPLEGFIPRAAPSEDLLNSFRERLRANADSLSGTPYADAVLKRAYQEVKNDLNDLVWAPYQLVYDTPDKGIRGRAEKADMIITPLVESLSTLTKELTVISPYFVPTRELMDGFIAASNDGKDVTIITNSLAANNQKTVHGGYAASRKPLLKAGVRMFEVRPDARIRGNEFVDSSAARSTLHTKAYILDRRELFIGSFNFDPRSMFINTEMGVLIRDPVLSYRVANDLDREISRSVWELSLDANGRLQWQGVRDGRREVHAKEPLTSWWERCKATIYRMLPIRSQL